MTSQKLWSSDKCKSRYSTCLGCSKTRHARSFSDDALRLPTDELFFPQIEKRSARDQEHGQHKMVSVTPQTWAFPVFGQGDESAEDSSQTVECQPLEDLWEQFAAGEILETSKEEVVAAPRAHTRTRSQTNQRQRDHVQNRDTFDRPLLDVDYETELPNALKYHEADMVSRCLFAAACAHDTAFIRELSDTTFTDIISLLEPANYIEQLASAHLGISGKKAKAFGIPQMQQVTSDYLYVVNEIARIQRMAGVVFTMDQYKILLRSARDLEGRGRGEEADQADEERLFDGEERGEQAREAGVAEDRS